MLAGRGVDSFNEPWPCRASTAHCQVRFLLRKIIQLGISRTEVKMISGMSISSNSAKMNSEDLYGDIQDIGGILTGDRCHTTRQSFPFESQAPLVVIRDTL
ncbi:hypothetical protein NPIL_598991 [Nephila pilipes]|uniref:Uncharacterized protein n=1 Tax=Nephila pilipes TaxID=299642 RepID=A0A8X6PUE3_NEPPI|nr:hypothetical protein NPIL_598991 [Nephila pilipes]